MVGPARNGPTAIRYTMGVGRQRKPGTTQYNRTTAMFTTVPTSAQIGTTLERAARITAILVAATLAAGFITRQTLTGLAAIVTRLTRRPLATLIDLIPSVTPAPEPTPPLLTLLGAEILTDAEMVAEIARYDADARKRPATTKTTARRKPARATKVAAGA